MSDERHKRRAPNLTEKLASLLVTAINPATGDPYVDREKAKTMSNVEIIRTAEIGAEWDHIIMLTIGGSYHGTNLLLRTKADHAAKTREDMRQIAKGRRLRGEIDEQRRDARIKSAIRSGNVGACTICGANFSAFISCREVGCGQRNFDATAVPHMPERKRRFASRPMRSREAKS